MTAQTGPWPKGSLLASLDPADRADLLALGTRVQFAHDQVLVLQGDPGEELYVLLDGFVKVTVATETGLQLPLMVRGRGELVGEFAVMDSGERTATVSAVGAVVAVRIGRTRFQEFAARHPDADHRIAVSVLGKMRAAIRRRAEARTWDARARLAAVLHELATDYGEPVPEGTMIGMPLSQFELGGLAAVAESTAERVLKGLRQDGLVLTRYRRIVVCDLAALAAIRDGARKP